MHADEQWQRCDMSGVLETHGGREVGVIFVESAKASWEPSATEPLGLCEIMDNPEGIQVHGPHSSKPKGTKWLEMRLNQGILGLDGQAP